MFVLGDDSKEKSHAFAPARGRGDAQCIGHQEEPLPAEGEPSREAEELRQGLNPGTH